MSRKKPNYDDIAIGARIKSIRLQRGISQEALGDGLGLTFQQVQKYEKGTNRIGGSRIVQIAKVLKVPIPALFGVDNDGKEFKVETFIDRPSRTRLVKLLTSADDTKLESALCDLIEAVTR